MHGFHEDPHEAVDNANNTRNNEEEDNEEEAISGTLVENSIDEFLVIESNESSNADSVNEALGVRQKHQVDLVSYVVAQRIFLKLCIFNKMKQATMECG